MGARKLLGTDVLKAAQRRIAWVFDEFPRIYLSFSAGKDSTVMLHLVAAEARRRGRKFGLLFVDLEAQYQMTIEHAEALFAEYADCTEPFWISLPLILRNAVSQFEPRWLCWDPEKRADWVREPSRLSITDWSRFPFFHSGMEFEEFVPAFGEWYSQGQMCACFVGIRTVESLNRWRTIAGHGTKFEGRGWTNWVAKTLWNIYPVYDWATEDIWTFHGRTGARHNALYDRMHQAGLTVHQMRICQPYGDDQRKGLWLFHIIEPQTWGRVVARVNGANQGALYAQESGNILGRLKIDKPPGHTWQSFAKMLLATMPDKSRGHYENKIAVFLKWYADRGFPNGIPDASDPKLEADKKAPSWRRVCKALLRNDYWFKGLSFTQQKTAAYEKYLKIMKKRRQRWNLI